MSEPAVIGPTRWRENWRALTTDGAVLVPLPRSTAGRRRSANAVRALATGTPVVLSAIGPGSSSRCRSFATETGLLLEREFLAFPSAAEPAYLVEDAPATVQLFLTNMLVTPPRARFGPAIGWALAILRRFGTRPILRLLAPGRLVVGRRA